MFNSLDIFKKTNLQDMLISPDFANFVSWFGELTEDNHLSADEIAKSNESKSMDSFNYDIFTVNENIQQIVGETLNNVDMLEDLQDDFDDLKDSHEALVDMLSTSSGTDTKIDTDLNRLNSEIHSYELKIESLFDNCKVDAQILEELRATNIENRNNLFTSFSGQHSSPLRWCRIDLDNYCIGCDNVSLSLKLRFEEKLRLLSFIDVDNDNMKRLYSLENLESIFLRNASAEFDAECDLKKVNILVDILSKPFQPMSYALMSEQVERLLLQNEDIEENIDNLESSINEKIGYLAYQEAKLCEIENNKEKLRAATKRLDLLKQVCKPISDNLLLGDLLWLSLHTEMETMKHILQNVSTAHYEEENKQCARNLQILTRISANTSEGHVANEFLSKVSEIIGENIVSKDMNSDDPYSIVDIFNESTIHHDTQLQHAVSDSYQMKVVNLIENCNAMSKRMNVFIGNGPSNKPNIWDLSILADLEVYKGKFDLMFDSARTMRHNFMEKYHQPFVNDELWKRRQLLWIWFLTDQKTFLEAFENTLGDSKMLLPGRMSIVGGIKRQQ